MKDILGKTFECSCGKTHEVPNIEILEASIREAPDVFSDAFFIADLNTASLVDLPGKRSFVFNERRPLATMENVEKIVKASGDFPEIVSIGSGSLTDIARYAAYLSGKRFSCVPTAPSVDAYTSTVAPILVNGVKKTFMAIPPRRILLDIEVLRNAPMDLLRAGVGDIVAKIPARMDWILSHIVTGEYICDFVWNDMKDLLKEILLKSKDILNRERNAIKTLMEAHLVSGINMVIMGNSRPASGAEHMVSHLIEMFHEEKGEMPPFHGLTVMIGVFVSMKAYEALVEKKEIPLKDYSIEERRKELLELFEERKVEEFLKTYAEKKFPKIEADIVREPMESIYKEFFPHLKRTLETIDVNSVINSYSKDFLSRVVRLANTIRDRFTVLDVFDEMKILKNFSRIVF
ncbi:sn-glycerol-1-phosphate dehydrogenase [Thermotoga petrophila]|uniref:sn-glycerol-1-phosphate dehydrogenase n=1 Tax=Thermotoga petrophila TaxID=93929 RepID=UPI002FDF0FB2